MSGLDKVGASIGKKLTLQNYKEELRQNAETVKHKKVKLTVYLSVDAINKLNEICADNLIQKGRLDKSSLMDHAVELLYEESKK